MKVGNCHGEHLAHMECGEHECVKTDEHGRRIKEKVVRTKNDDGTGECIHELYEEVVPMRLKQRVSRKKMTIPVEERVEEFAEDGTVQTHTKSLAPETLDLNHEPTTLDGLAHELRAAIGEHKVCTCKHKKTGHKRRFMKMAAGRYGAAAVQGPTEVEVSTGSGTETVLTGIGYIALAVALGLLTFVII